MKHVCATGLVLLLALACDGSVAPCNFDEDCRADAVCLEGVCALRAPPAPPRPCPDDKHDGGDGTCIALDACSDGFTLLFRDGDGDGTGVGDRVDCGPLPPPLGLADVDGDCDDDDPGGFITTESFADADNDGFTTRVFLCGNGAPPAGAPLVARPAPVLAAHPEDLNLAFDDDLGEELEVRDFGVDDSGVDVTGLRCPTTPGPVVGVAVHARVTLLELCCSEEAIFVTAGARFTDENQTQSEGRFATSTPLVLGETTDIVFGGFDDAFGVDANGLCDDTLRVVLLGITSAESGEFTDRAAVLIDAVWLELFAAEDCDDADASVYSPATLFDDSDGDGSGGGDGAPVCIGSDLPIGAQLAPLDCDDADPAVRLEQTAFFPTASAGGTFDYDCNGILEPERVTTAVTCAIEPDVGCIAAEGVAPPAECGALVDAQQCDGSCNFAGISIVQRCR